MFQVLADPYVELLQKCVFPPTEPLPTGVVLLGISPELLWLFELSLQDSLAVLHCVKDLNPEAALQGLKDFSHVWVLYVFHENTNSLRETKSARPFFRLCIPSHVLQLDIGFFETK